MFVDFHGRPEGIQIEPRRPHIPGGRATDPAGVPEVPPRQQHLVDKRLPHETIQKLVAEYVAGTPSAELGRRYGLAKSTVLNLLRGAGVAVRHPRLSHGRCRVGRRALQSGAAAERDCCPSGPEPWCRLARLAASGSRGVAPVVVNCHDVLRPSIAWSQITSITYRGSRVRFQRSSPGVNRGDSKRASVTPGSVDGRQR
jgi:hypothetical protein